MEKTLSKILSIFAITVIIFVSSCGGQNVGKYCQPNGMCAATKDYSVLQDMVQTAKDGGSVMTYVEDGRAFLLDATLAYKIVEEGSYWYKVEMPNGKTCFVHKNLVDIK
jgi:hypothetical protein